MSYESIRALERIVTLCERSDNLTQRQVRIFDIALEGLGLVSGQRAEIVAKWKQPHIDKITARRERRLAIEAMTEVEAA